jgi:predicted glycoside hydrolase/deacetylase ChbG (UPF0249 family)
VIINADDFGLSDGVARGIGECRASGLILSTTAMTCVDGAGATIEKYAPQFGDGIGVHLQLTHGRPVSPPDEIPTLVGADGRFPGQLGAGRLNPVEIATEWRAQIERLRSWGVEPDHLDSHHNVHTIAARHREVLPVYARLAAEFGLPVRSGKRRVAKYLRAKGIPCPDVVVNFAAIDTLIARLDKERAAGPTDLVVEICCHPGFADAALAAVVIDQRAVAIRDVERVALTGSEFRSRLAAAGWEIVRYRDLARLVRRPSERRGNLFRRIWRRAAANAI